MRRAALVFGLLVLAAIGLAFSQAGCVVSVGDHHPAPVYAPPPPEPGPPPWAPAHGHRAKHHYYYYPDSHVYFDTGRSTYFYYSGGSWRASAYLPSGIQISVGEHVALDMDNDRPYMHHADVEKRYPPGQMKKHGKDKDKDKGKGKGKDKWD